MWNLLIFICGWMLYVFLPMEGTNDFEDRIDKDWEPKYIVATVLPENYFLVETEEKTVCDNGICRNILSKTIKSQVVE